MKLLSAFLLFGFFIVDFTAAQNDVPWPPDPGEIVVGGIDIVSIAYQRMGQSETPVAANESHVDPLATCPNSVGHDMFLSAPQWVFVTELLTEQVFLCHVETGEKHGPLSAQTAFWSDVLPSPDGRYLLLRGLDAGTADRGGPYNFYGYELATKRFHFLSSIASVGYASEFVEWLNKEHMLYRYSWSVGDTEYFVMDVTRPNSIEHAIAGDFVQRREQPPRLEVLTTHSAVTRHADLTEHIACSLDVFDMEAITTHHYALGYNCGGVYSPDGYRYFYVTFQQDPHEMSSLNMLDLRSSHPTVILESEIEALESVSPDGRYAAIITDNNGVIDRNTMEDVQFFSWSQTNNPVVSFVDVSQGRVVYELPFDRWIRNLDSLYERVTHETYASGIPQVGVVWLDDYRCLVKEFSDATQEWEHVLLEFTATGVVRTPLAGYVELIVTESPYVVLFSQTEERRAIYSLYDIETHEQRPLLLNPYPDDYSYMMVGGEKMQINLTISRQSLVSSAGWVEYVLAVEP